MPLRAILFDFDDTLIDWSGVQLDWRGIEASRLENVLLFLQSQGQDSLALDALIDDYTARTRKAWSNARRSLRAPHMPTLLMQSLAHQGLTESAQMSDEIMAAYDWRAVPGTAVYPDVPPALELLRDCHIKTGIVTNSSQTMQLRDAELRDHGLIDYFPDCRLAAADVGFLKPHRRIFRAALDQLGTPASETVFVGDNPVADIAGAQALGMRAILRLNRGESYNGHLAVPDARVRSFAQLPAILDHWFPGWRGSEA